MIRPYQSHDLEAVNRVFRESFDEAYKYSQLSEGIEKGYAWVNEEEVTHEITGYIVTTIKDGFPYIYNIGVSPAHRRKSIATWLIDTAESAYSNGGWNSMWLYVSATNPAINLYKRLGYQVTGIARDMYGPQQDGYSMEKKLK